MITLCILLLLLGLSLLIVEMFFPGFGVCGITGVVLLILSGVLAVAFVPFGWIFVTAEVIALAAVIYGAYLFIKRKQLHGKLIMTDTLNEDVLAVGNLSSFLGKEGVAKTPLRPFGEVDFNGISLEASSNGAYIESGKRVRVIEVGSNKLIVAELK